jgi:hypothetical protein
VAAGVAAGVVAMLGAAEDEDAPQLEVPMGQPSEGHGRGSARRLTARERAPQLCMRRQLVAENAAVRNLRGRKMEW